MQESMLCSQEPRAHDSFEETLVVDALPGAANLAVGPWPIFNELFPSWTMSRQCLPIWCIELGLGETLLGCTRMGLDGCGPRHSRYGWVPGLHHRQTVRPTGPMCCGPCPRSVAETEPSEAEGQTGQLPSVVWQHFVQQIVQTSPGQLVVPGSKLLSDTRRQNSQQKVSKWLTTARDSSSASSFSNTS